VTHTATRTAAPRPFGADEEANRAVIEALADAYKYAVERKRFERVKFRNMDAEGRARDAVEALSAEIDSRASKALVAPAAFRDAVQVEIWKRHGRDFSIAPLSKRDGAAIAQGQDLDVQAMAADEQVEKLQGVLRTIQRKAARAEADLRLAQVKAADLHSARDRFRAEQSAAA
jgi:hypothetical protein